MKTPPISSVLTLMFMTDLNITDNTDLIRCNILATEIECNNHTIESIKLTGAYLGCQYNVPISDDFLQSLLDRKEILLKM